MINKLLSKDAIIFDFDATNKNDAIAKIAKVLADKKFVTDEKLFEQALLDREKQFSTGIGEEIAIPHAQSKLVLKNVVLIAKLKKPIKWGSLDDKDVKYIFSIALNDKDISMQTEVLQALSQAIMNPQTKVNLKNSKNIDDLFDALEEKQEEAIQKIQGAKNIIAVTACPTGIAHTYMAAENIQKTAQEQGFNVKVETQGRKIDNRLTDKDIAEADAIILAIDKGIEGMERFNGKTVLKTSTKRAIHEPKELITEALSGKGEIVKVANSDSSSSSNAGDYSWSAFKNVYKNLMGGVSRMLPFVVAGGILLGIAFLLDSGKSGGGLGSTRDIAKWFAGLGKVSFGAFVPVLGAYVAYSIVGAEGLMPGMVAGFIASGGGILYSGFSNGSVVTDVWSNMWGQLTPGINQDVISAGSGFIGAMVGGYLAAAAVTILRRYAFAKVNKNFRGVVDIVAMPIASILLTGVAMFIVQIPIAYFAYALKLFVKVLSDNNILVLLTIVLAVMMATDMGGPINKVAYVLGTSGLSAGTQNDYVVMGAVMAGGMVPPLALAFSTLLWRNKAWSSEEIESGKANWLLGLFFITEGAIPFAARDPKRVIPCLMLSSAIVGLFIGIFKIGVSAPHGGIIVCALFKSYLFHTTGSQIGMGIVLLLLGLIAGMGAGGFVLGFWRNRAVKSGKLVLNTKH